MINNKIRIIGHVGHNPQVTTFEDTGNKLVKFSVAVTEYSSRKEEKSTLWFDVDSWNGLADRVEKVVTKGREIDLEGRLAFSTYTKETKEGKLQVMKPVIKLTDFYVCGPRPAGSGDGDAEENKQEESSRQLALV